MNKLEIYFSNEQPTTCPKCGIRTEFIEIGKRQENHTCLSTGCKYKFIIEHEK